jgi:ubiquinone/menaquinone biosynthesis C-methylase UbiE
MKLSIQSTSNNIITCDLFIDSKFLFDLDFQLDLSSDTTETQTFHIRQKGWDVSWLPKGSFKLIINLTEAGINPANYRCRIIAFDNANVQSRAIVECSGNLVIANTRTVLSPSIHWDISSDQYDMNKFSWKKGYSDWFYRHFDHAARVIKDLMFKNSQELNGKILDVGCGDGVTDLGLYLRTNPELLVGIDPFEGYKNLEKFALENNLPKDLIHPENLIFSNASGNKIPYEDDFFDCVLSWGSLEHIAGGYEQTLNEITRVLKPNGILFAHPGLFYGECGNHLGEFFEDPFIHLKIPEPELKQRLMSAPRNYMDRAGQTFPPEDYWQWYKELNPITTDSLEKQLRNLGYQPWRVALRTSNVVEFTDELQNHSIYDLSVSELYGTFRLVSK